MLSLKRLLRHRIAYGRLITPETRVDPGEFPEEEFPVHCMKCGYELRGLVEPRCPECGTPFDRGRLLVEHYVLWRQPRSNRCYRISLWLWRLAWAVLLLWFVLWAAFMGVHRSAAFAIEDAFELLGLSKLMYVIFIFLRLRALFAALLFAHVLLWWIASPRYGQKPRQVVKAIPRKQSS